MDITDILTLFGGVALFIYGMDYLGAALKMVAGAKLESVLERLTDSKTKGLLLGTGVTAVIQSSAATVVIVLGFINAGIMGLAQAVPVVFGANVGSTVTGQLLRLGDIATKNIFLTLLKPSTFAPVLIAVGVLMMMVSKKKNLNVIAQLLLGLGILFFGMTTMEESISPLQDSEQFQQLFTAFTNPFLGILAGTLLTAVIQSSSASVGILQALTSTGTVTWATAVPIIIGQNIGKCLPVVISGLHSNKDGKRLALIHVGFNLLGAILWGSLIYLARAIFQFPFWNDVLNRGNVADFHTLYNLATALLLTPFTGWITKLSEHIIKDDEEDEKENKSFEQLNDMFLNTPSLALEQSRRVVCQMGEVTLENFRRARSLMDVYDEGVYQELEEKEAFLDRAETKVCEYLIKITSSSLEVKDTRLANELLRSIADFERIGDYCVRIANVARYDMENDVTFSEDARRELASIMDASENILLTTVDAYIKENKLIASRVEPMNEVINALRLMLEDHHVERLQKTHCSVEAGISFKELLNCLDRVAGHSVNISVFLIQRLNDPYKFDAHEHLKSDHQEMTEEYKALYTYYESLYYTPVASLPAIVELEDQPEEFLQAEETAGEQPGSESMQTPQKHPDKKGPKHGKQGKKQNNKKK